MPINDFKPFGIGVGNEVTAQATWAASTMLAKGYGPGILTHRDLNKGLRQASVISAALAQYITNISGTDTLDDGDFDAIVAKLTAAIATGSSSNTLMGLNVLNYIPEPEHAAIKAGTSTYDCHPAIQACFNDASNSWTRKIIIPAGRYYIPETKALRTYYHVTDNPGYNQLRNAHIELIGEGKDSESSGSGVPGNLCGSVFWSDPTVNRTLPILIVSPAAMDALPYYGRDFIARDLSIDGKFLGDPADEPGVTNSTGVLVDCQGVPGANFYNFQIFQRGLTGHGIKAATWYIGGFHNCRIQNKAAGTPTGNAMTCTATIAAGNYLIDSACNFDGFAHGIRAVGGDFQQLKIESSQITGKVGHILVDAAARIQVLEIPGCYSEGVADFWIKGATANRIGTLDVGPGFVFGAGYNQAAIQLDKPDAVRIQGVRVQDLKGTFMDIASIDTAAKAAFVVSATHFVYGPGVVVTPRTLFTGVLPTFDNVEWPEANPLVILYSAAGPTPIQIKSRYAADSSSIKAGHLFQTHAVTVSPASAGVTYYHASQGFPAIGAFGTSAGTSIYELKSGATAKLGDWFSLEVINRGGGVIECRKEIGGALIATVAANTTKRLYWSDLFGDWLP